MFVVYNWILATVAARLPFPLLGEVEILWQPFLEFHIFTNIVDKGLKVLFLVFFANFGLFSVPPFPSWKRLNSAIFLVFFAIFRSFFRLPPWRFFCWCPCTCLWVHNQYPTNFVFLFHTIKIFLIQNYTGNFCA